MFNLTKLIRELYPEELSDNEAREAERRLLGFFAVLHKVAQDNPHIINQSDKTNKLSEYEDNGSEN